MARPTPYQLWVQSKGDRDEYLRLMREHGHIITASEGGVRLHEPVAESDHKEET